MRGFESPLLRHAGASSNSLLRCFFKAKEFLTAPGIPAAHHTNRELVRNMVQNLELEEFLEEQPTQVDQTPEPAAEAQVSEEQVSEEQEEVSKQAPQVPEKPKSKKNMLNLFLPVLTVLLLLVGVCEAAFWGWFGFTSYRQNLARQRYEQQLADLEEERLAKGITGGSAYGPWRKVENGTVTWQREELLADGGSQEDGGPSPEKAPTRLSTLSVPIIPYVLAEQEWSSSEKEQSPEQDPS